MKTGFKEFIMRGNVVDMAVGIVIGAAFTAFVNSLVKDMITPLIAAIIKVPDFSGLTFTVRGSVFTYGTFINAVLSFLIVAASMYFVVVLPMTRLMERMKKLESAPAKPPTTKNCPECLSEIPVAAKRCAYCSSVVE